MKNYDFLIVGAGLYGAICACELKKQGYKILVIEKRNHIAGNIYTENCDGIDVHKYGAHIFHTNDKEVWNYVNSFGEFNRFTNSPLANHKDFLYNLPFNMNTFYQLWGVKTPQEARNKIEEQRKEIEGKIPSNLEEQAISLVGRDIYEKLIKGYTEKQWGRDCKELPAFIINRLPVRFTFDNNYFSDKYQGIPVKGYTKIISKMLDGIDILLNTDYLHDKDKYNNLANKIIYTGPIDAFFDYKFGKLEYRSLEFKTEKFNIDNYQGNAVVNFTERDIPYTRIIEHKHFNNVTTEHTIITKEYPCEWTTDKEAYYPVNNKKNMDIYSQYESISKNIKNIYFGGRLAEYKYYDMHQIVRNAIDFTNK